MYCSRTTVGIYLSAIKTSLYTCTAAAQWTSPPTKTCEALMHISVNDFNCTSNEECDTLHCTFTNSPTNLTFTLMFLPCNHPPAGRLTFFSIGQRYLRSCVQRGTNYPTGDTEGATECKSGVPALRCNWNSGQHTIIRVCIYFWCVSISVRPFNSFILRCAGVSHAPWLASVR